MTEHGEYEELSLVAAASLCNELLGINWRGRGGDKSKQT